jgi:hypothetical protein
MRIPFLHCHPLETEVACLEWTIIESQASARATRQFQAVQGNRKRRLVQETDYYPMFLISYSYSTMIQPTTVLARRIREIFSCSVPERK